MAAVLLLFAWKGSSLTVPWPAAPAATVVVPKPDPVLLEWAEPMKAISTLLASGTKNSRPNIRKRKSPGSRPRPSFCSQC